MKKIAAFHPLSLFVYFLSVISVAMLVGNPVIGLCALLGGAAFFAVLRSGKGVRGDAVFYIAMFLTISLSNPLFSHNGTTPLFFVNGTPVTLESVAYGVGAAVMIVSVILWCACYSEIMTDDKMTYLVGRAIPRLSLILTTAQRLIPRFLRRMKTVRGAQKAVGMYRSESYFERVRSALRVFYAMTAWAAENSIETASAMKARGDGLPGRTNFFPFRFRASDGALLAASCVLLAVTLVGIGMGVCEFEYYPTISKLPVSVSSVIVYVSFCALSFFQGLIEVGGELKWKYYVSRI